MKVLVINSGSSSLKYQLIDMETENVIAKGTCERIGIDGSKLTHKAKHLLSNVVMVSGKIKDSAFTHPSKHFSSITFTPG